MRIVICMPTGKEADGIQDDAASLKLATTNVTWSLLRWMTRCKCKVERIFPLHLFFRFSG